MPLAGNQRRYLRSLGHHLKPVVQVGHQGVTAAVTKQLAGALQDHELVKVKLAEAVEDRAGAAAALAEGTGAEWVQSLGRTVLLYKARTEKPEITLPKAHGTPQSRLPAPRRRAAMDDDDVEAAEGVEDDDE